MDRDFSLFFNNNYSSSLPGQSTLFTEFANLLGVKHITTASHLCDNSLAERFHRHIKVALTANKDCRTKIGNLTMVFSSIRNVIKEDVRRTASEMFMKCQGCPQNRDSFATNPITYNQPHRLQRMSDLVFKPTRIREDIIKGKILYPIFIVLSRLEMRKLRIMK